MCQCDNGVSLNRPFSAPCSSHVSKFLFKFPVAYMKERLEERFGQFRFRLHFRMKMKIDPFVFRTGRLAGIAAVQAVADFLPDFIRNKSLCLGPITDASLGVNLSTLNKRSGRTSFEIGRAHV